MGPSVDGVHEDLAANHLAGVERRGELEWRLIRLRFSRW
jgi:hypothetical protein